MSSWHTIGGILLLGLTIAFFVRKYVRARKEAAFPAWGWAGLAIIVGSEWLLFLKVQWAATFFTPIVWTGYLLLVDALVWRLQGQSLLGSEPGQFMALAFWSVPLWLIFEAYNLRLANWTYVGLPANAALRAFGYVWSFATIWPAIYETASFTEALGLFRQHSARCIVFPRSAHVRVIVLGLLLLTLPVLVPVRIGQYLFASVWVGFVFLLDPLNYRWNGRSLLRDWERGRTATLGSLLVAGLVCGIFWEFWNNWASAKWLYVFPIWQRSRIFQMPLPGYLGFPAFALECFAMYEFVRSAKHRLVNSRRIPRWETQGSRL